MKSQEAQIRPELVGCRFVWSDWSSRPGRRLNETTASLQSCIWLEPIHPTRGNTRVIFVGSERTLCDACMTEDQDSWTEILSKLVIYRLHIISIGCQIASGRSLARHPQPPPVRGEWRWVCIMDNNKGDESMLDGDLIWIDPPWNHSRWAETRVLNDL